MALGAGSGAHVRVGRKATFGRPPAGLTNTIFGRYSFLNQHRQDPPWTSNLNIGNGGFATDYNIRNLSAATEAAPIGGKNEFTIQSPFSGLGTLDVCQGNLLADDPCGSWWDLDPKADPYSFTATTSITTL